MLLIKAQTEELRKKAEEFLNRIEGLLEEKAYTFAKSFKNQDFLLSHPLTQDDRGRIIKQLTAEDCIRIAPNDNPRYPEAEIYAFIREVDFSVFGEDAHEKLYIKMYLREIKDRGIVVVISFHEEGQF